MPKTNDAQKKSADRKAVKLEKKAIQKQQSNSAEPKPPTRPPPAPRLFLPVVSQPIYSRSARPTSAMPLRSLSIMTYNLLAQCLCRRELYPYCGKDDLKYKRRFPMLVTQIKSLAPDVACLQEVDHFNDLIAPELRQAGYEYEYLKKNPEKDTGHGLCIIWKADMFTRHQYRSVIFDESPLTHPTPITPVTGNIGQLVALKFRDPSHDIAGGQGTALSGSSDTHGVIVTNSHLFWRPTAKYEKLRQAYVMLHESVQFRRSVHKENAWGQHWPIIMCGDWNSTPDDGIYRSLTQKSLTAEQLAELEPVEFAKNNKGSVPPEATPAIENLLPVSTLLERLEKLPRLSSCYSTYRQSDPDHTVNPDWKDKPLWEGEPSYTNYAQWKGTLDYIFVADDDSSTEDNRQPVVQVAKVLEVPKADDLAPGLPNVHFPSDHVPLMAQLELFR